MMYWTQETQKEIVPQEAFVHNDRKMTKRYNKGGEIFRAADYVPKHD